MSKEERVIPVRTSRVLDIVVGGGAELVAVTTRCGEDYRENAENRRGETRAEVPRRFGSTGSGRVAFFEKGEGSLEIFVFVGRVS